MDEEILKQQKILAETLRLAIQRLEEASKFYQEKASECRGPSTQRSC